MKFYLLGSDLHGFVAHVIFGALQDAMQRMRHCINGFVNVARVSQFRHIISITFKFSQVTGFLASGWSRHITLHCLLTLKFSLPKVSNQKIIQAADGGLFHSKAKRTSQNVKAGGGNQAIGGDPGFHADELQTHHIMQAQLLQEVIHLNVGQETHDDPRRPSPDHLHHLQEFFRLSPVEFLRVLHAHPFLLSRGEKYRHAVVAVVAVTVDCSDPSPAEVLNQLGEGSALVEVAGDGSKEGRVLLPVTQTLTGGRMAYLRVEEIDGIKMGGFSGSTG